MIRKLLCVIMVSVFLISGCATTRKWSTTEKVMVVGSAVATAADYYTTKQALRNPNNRELNPILGDHPSDMRLIGTMMISNLIIMLLAHKFPELRKPILGFNIVVHGAAAIHNNGVD